MTRLQTEWQRLFLVDGGLIDAQRQVRALVVGLARPGDWSALRQLWQGVQQDLGWPAPAIAVNGVDGYQLWLALSQAVPAAQAEAVGRTLVARYLSEARPDRIDVWPQAGEVHAPAVPLLQAGTELWSAFVAPDLAPVFEDTPFLDFPPGEDGQADLLARLQCVSPGDWRRGLAVLAPAAGAEAVTEAVRGGPVAAPPAAGSASPDVGHVHPEAPSAHGLHVPIPATHRDPVRFLQDVMANEAVPLALRVEAAKALMHAKACPP